MENTCANTPEKNLKKNSEKKLDWDSLHNIFSEVFSEVFSSVFFERFWGLLLVFFALVVGPPALLRTAFSQSPSGAARLPLGSPWAHLSAGYVDPGPTGLSLAPRTKPPLDPLLRSHWDPSASLGLPLV